MKTSRPFALVVPIADGWVTRGAQGPGYGTVALGLLTDVGADPAPLTRSGWWQLAAESAAEYLCEGMRA